MVIDLIGLISTISLLFFFFFALVLIIDSGIYWFYAHIFKLSPTESYFIIIISISDSSVGKESACNAGDPGSIPGLERSAREGIIYALQYTWASIVAQLVKNLLAVWETWVWSLSWEDPLEKGKATHSSILTWRIPWTIQSMGLQRVRYDWATFKKIVTLSQLHNYTILEKTSFSEDNLEIY